MNIGNVVPADPVTIDLRARGGLHVFHEKPRWAGLENAPLELWNQILGDRIPIGLDEMPQPRERLTGWATDYPIKATRRRMEIPNVPPENDVRPLHDRKALQLESHPEKIGTREQREHELTHAPPTFGAMIPAPAGPSSTSGTLTR